MHAQSTNDSNGPGSLSREYLSKTYMFPNCPTPPLKKYINLKGLPNKKPAHETGPESVSLETCLVYRTSCPHNCQIWLQACLKCMPSYEVGVHCPGPDTLTLAHYESCQAPSLMAHLRMRSVKNLLLHIPPVWGLYRTYFICKPRVSFSCPGPASLVHLPMRLVQDLLPLYIYLWGLSRTCFTCTSTYEACPGPASLAHLPMKPNQGLAHFHIYLHHRVYTLTFEACPRPTSLTHPPMKPNQEKLQNNIYMISVHCAVTSSYAHVFMRPYKGLLP
jgi:hypothetical protein